ncbi:terminase small subunit [Dysgonomonas sp. 511]|uniref:terminase small subunit n=1 Tax=Dysgonomonas sp. 511 TaxID=2302930 RepID=UPI0013D10727|nr:terminase small subunit [Dysgonomonas sp. 511]NDV79348.1 hypothetical protein [Dysgonomonas sp. 511]
MKKRKLRNGKERLYTHSDKLLNTAFEYFAWCDENPLLKKELMRSGERKGELIEVPVSRPYTISGLCVFCQISEATFRSFFRSDEMCAAALHIQDIIKQNQMEGAIAGIYNSAIVCRLVDSSNVEEEEQLKRIPFVVKVIDNETKEELEDLRDHFMS